MKNRRLYDPDPATDDKGGNAEPKETTAVDLSTKIKTEDGKEVTIGSLIEAQKKAQQLEEGVASAANFEKLVKVMLSDNASDEERIAATSSVLKAQGVTDEALGQHLVKLGLIDPVEEDEELPDDDNEAAIEELRKENENIKAEMAENARQAIVDRMEQVVDAALSKERTVQALLKKHEGDEEKQGKVRNFVIKMIHEKAKGELAARNTGLEKFTLDWINDAVNNAMPKAVEELRVVIPDFDDLGGSSAVTAPSEEELFKAKGGKKTDFPKPNQDGQFDEQVLNEAMTDALTLLSHQAAAEDIPKI